MTKDIGQHLRQVREQQSLTLEQVSRETRIRVRYLQALEDGELGVLPSAVQVRGFLRSYAEFLGLKPQSLLDALRQTGDQAEPSESPKPPPPQESHQNTLEQVEAIFKEIGSAIKTRREMLGLSLEDVEQHTHISEHYAKLIEAGEFTRFPSPVQARGMLVNFVNFLEMDSHAVLLRYAEALQTRLTATQAVERETQPQPKPKRDPERPRFRLPLWMRNVLSADSVILGIVGVAAIVFTIWGVGRIFNIQSNTQAQPTAPAISGVLFPSDTPLPQPSPTIGQAVTPTSALLEVEDNPDLEETQAPTLPPITGANINIYIIVRQRTYLRVTVDGVVEFDGRTLPGTNLPFTGINQIEVLTGNGAAIQVFFNDVDMGVLGIFGEVVRIIYTREGVIEPTPEVTPTSIAPSPTPTPTNTPLP